MVGGTARVDSTFGFMLARCKTDGSLDGDFGDGGLVYTNVGDDGGYALAIQPDDKIVVVGANWLENTYDDFGVARYEANGSPDESFGTGGEVPGTQTDIDILGRIWRNPSGQSFNSE